MILAALAAPHRRTMSCGLLPSGARRHEDERPKARDAERWLGSRQPTCKSTLNYDEILKYLRAETRRTRCTAALICRWPKAENFRS